MATIKLTAKRQATLPKELCDDLGVGPGDQLSLERHVIAGEVVWALRPRQPDWSWFGGLSQYAAGKSHDWVEIQESVEKGRRKK